MSRGPPNAYHEQTKKNRRTLGFVGIFSVIVVYWITAIIDVIRR